MNNNLRALCLAAAVALPLAAACQPARVAVPFVGCPSDGQAGPHAAPAGGALEAALAPEIASRMAFYGSSDNAVIPGPRGWHCVGFYGSGGHGLVLTPSPAPAGIDAKFAEPAIELKVSHGDTSGRFAVARVVARIFPDEQAFVERVAGEGVASASDFPTGPYPSDRVTYRTARVAEFVTAARSEGLGTAGRLIANDSPVLGVAMLEGAEPNLIILAVRLPPELGALAAPIIAEFLRRDGAAVPPR